MVMITAEQELQYWRALAEERGRQLEALRGRLLAVLESSPDAPVSLLAGSFWRQEGWLDELDRIDWPAAVHPDEVFTMLHEVWERTARR